MRWLLTPILAMTMLISPVLPAKAAEPEIWFAPLGPAVDLLDMWSNDAPWQEAAKKVKVLVLVHWWVRQQSDAALIKVFDFAKQHQMRIDLSTEPIAKLPGDTCGNEESYMSVGEMTDTVARLVQLGVVLDSVDMDGPVMSGSYDTSPNGCRYSIPDLVERVAMTMRHVVAAYPNVKIIEIEPAVTLVQQPTWRQDETAFQLGLAKTLGKPVRGMMLDVQWHIPAWKAAMQDIYRFVRQKNMALGVIYNGSPQAPTDADWINSTVANWEAVEGELHIIPNQAVFTSWDAHPSHNMPDTEPTAQTWLLNRYPRPRSALQVTFVGQGARGRLTTSGGKPIANATVQAFKPGVDFSKPLPVKVMTGIVPPTAVQALLAIRINTECSCDGLNDLLFGPVTYQETQYGSLNSVYTFTTTPGTMNGAILDGEIVGGTRVSRVIAKPGQALSLNGPMLFPVTANARYSLSIPAATIGGLGWFGNVLIIFVDAQGNGLRASFVPSSGKALMSTAVTKADGTFELFPVARSAEGPYPVTVEFDGGGVYRSTVWSPLR